MYEETDRIVEKWSVIFHFVCVTGTEFLVVLLFILTLVITLIIKYTKGLEHFEYTATFPAW